jgi:uncharacterized protein YqgC (DUF456 family)
VDWAYYAALLLAGAIGLVLTFAGMPGNWLLVAAAGAYAWATGFAHLGPWGLGTLLALATLAEFLETALGGVTAGRAGGSKRGMAGAILGGIAGVLIGTPLLAIPITALLPIPVLGTVIGSVVGMILGGLAGTFIGAYGVERLWLKRAPSHALKISTHATAGKLAGIVIKVTLGVIMLAVAALWALPLPLTTPATTPPTTTPTSAPSH